MAKKQKCRFVKLGSTYHCGAGPIGSFKISKARGRGWSVSWTGGAAYKPGSTWAPTLNEAKRLVAFKTGCSLGKR